MFVFWRGIPRRKIGLKIMNDDDSNSLRLPAEIFYKQTSTSWCDVNMNYTNTQLAIEQVTLAQL